MDIGYIDKSYYYDKNDLGISFLGNDCIFKLWSPVASKAYVCIYEKHNSVNEKVYEMKKESSGVFSVKLPLNGCMDKYYRFRAKINDKVKMEELICDGVLLSTSAGSTAYNLSAHGSILPLDSNILALTPISAFRPRRWRGALLSEISKIDFEVLNNDERSSSVTADNVEFRDISRVNIVSSDENKCTVLFDSKHSIEDKILNEQFNF